MTTGSPTPNFHTPTSHTSSRDGLNQILKVGTRLWWALRKRPSESQILCSNLLKPCCCALGVLVVFCYQRFGEYALCIYNLLETNDEGIRVLSAGGMKSNTIFLETKTVAISQWSVACGFTNPEFQRWAHLSHLNTPVGKQWFPQSL